MRESLFLEFILRIFPKLQPLIEKINGKRNADVTYLHKTMLRMEYSADQKWESASLNTTYVAADMVAMDSPLPPKKRDSIAHSNGKLPKIGMKKIMRETHINQVNIMKAQGASFANIATKLTQDALACSVGIDEKNEMNFLTALSDGIILTPAEDENGNESNDIAMRINFNFLEENTFTTKKKGEVTLDDIRKVLDKAEADGNTISAIAIAKSTYNKLRATQGAKELVADAQGKVYDNDTKLPVPTAPTFDSAFEDEFGCSFLKIDRTVITEKNGKRTPVKPFNANKLTFLVDSNEVGALVWGTLAEKTNPVNGVVYSTIDQYKLIARYSKTDPLQEFTSGQALVLPVLENIDQIYSLSLEEAEEVNATEEAKDSTDVKVTIGDKTVTKAKAVTAFASVGTSISATAADEEFVAAYNDLTAAQKKAFLKEVE